MRPGRLAWRLGWRALTAPSSRAASRFLLSSSLAMALGLVPLVLVLSIADGMIESISARTIATALYDFQFWRLGAPETAAEGRTELAAVLKAVPGVTAVWPEQQGFGLGYAGTGGRLGLQIRGIDPAWGTSHQGAGRFLRAVEGRLAFSTPTSVWLGREAARKLGVKPGGELKLLTTRSRGSLTLPRVTTVRVDAVISVGYQELDRLWLFAPTDLTAGLFDPQDQPVFWGVSTDRPLDETPRLLAELRAAAGGRWQTVSWQSTGRSQFLNYQATRTLLAIVMGLVLLVAAVNVSTAMITTVSERRRETAILKALGAPAGLVRGQFLVLGFGAGLLGTAAGLGLGMAAALGVGPLVAGADALMSLATGGGFHLLDSAFYLETIPVRFDPVVLGLAGLGSVALAVTASWIPARKASRERPLEVMRRA